MQRSSTQEISAALKQRTRLARIDVPPSVVRAIDFFFYDDLLMIDFVRLWQPADVSAVVT